MSTRRVFVITSDLHSTEAFGSARKALLRAFCVIGGGAVTYNGHKSFNAAVETLQEGRFVTLKRLEEDVFVTVTQLRVQ